MNEPYGGTNDHLTQKLYPPNPIIKPIERRLQDTFDSLYLGIAERTINRDARNLSQGVNHLVVNISHYRKRSCHDALRPPSQSRSRVAQA